MLSRVGPGNHLLDGGAHWRNLANTVESLMCGGNAAIFGRPFVKRFALCYQTVVCLSCLSCLSVCLSLTLAYCGQTVGWIKLKLGMQVGLGPGHIVLDGDPAPPRKGEQQPPPTFRPTLLWHGRPSQQLLSSCSLLLVYMD